MMDKVMEKQITKQELTPVTFYLKDTTSIGKLDTMETGFSLTTKYKTADDWAAHKGKELKVYYMGLQHIPNGDGELVICGKFLSKEECFISGQKVLIEAVKDLPEGTAISIIYKERRANKSTDGSTMIFDVALLQ